MLPEQLKPGAQCRRPADEYDEAAFGGTEAMRFNVVNAFSGQGSFLKGGLEAVHVMHLQSQAAHPLIGTPD